MALTAGITCNVAWRGPTRGRSCRPCSRPLARAGVPPGRLRGAARQAPRRRGSLPRTGSPTTGRPARSPLARPARDCPLPARRASGRAPGAAGDGQRKWQTVYRDSPTSCPSMSSANLSANTGTCRQRSALGVANAQDVTGINLPVDSQTLYTGQACKQSLMAGRRYVTYVNSRPPVRGIVSVQYQVLSPWPVPAGPRPSGPREGVRPGEGRRARRLAGARAGAGKAAGVAGKARGRTVINSAAVSDGMRGNRRGN
jgi:hypothetical protein